MNARPPWVVLVRGSRDWVEGHVKSYMDQLEPDELLYVIRPGTDKYQAVYGTRQVDIGMEGQLAEELSGNSTDPVYAIDLGSDEPVILRFLNRHYEVEDTDADTLARALGCPLPQES